MKSREITTQSLESKPFSFEVWDQPRPDYPSPFLERPDPNQKLPSGSHSELENHQLENRQTNYTGTVLGTELEGSVPSQ